MEIPGLKELTEIPGLLSMVSQKSGGMHYIEADFQTGVQANDYVENYLGGFHPAGYHTRAKLTPNGDGTIHVKISRYTSCD